MARKKTGKTERERTVNETEQPNAAAGRALGRPRQGPWWLARREQWMATVAGKQYYGPRGLGQADLVGARKWYRELMEKLGIQEPVHADPDGPRQTFMTMLSARTIREIAELQPVIATEHLLAATSRGHVVSVAIHEAWAKRLGEGGK